MKASARVISQQLAKSGIKRFNKGEIGSSGFSCRQEGNSVIITWIGLDSRILQCGHILWSSEYIVTVRSLNGMDYLEVSKKIPEVKQVDLSVKHTVIDEDLIRQSLLQLGFEQDSPLRDIKGFQVWCSPLLELGWIITNKEKPDLANKVLAALESLGYESQGSRETVDGQYIKLTFGIKKESSEEPHP
jgi:hypothetical protein